MCSENPGVLSTDKFYAGTFHIITVFEIPLQLFGAYIVLMKTPSKMGNVKNIMFLLHLVCALSDFYFSCMTIPVLTLPICSGYPLGILSILGVPTDILVYIGVSFVGVILVTILIFFEDRHYRLKYGHIQNGSRNWKRGTYAVVHYSIAATFVLPTFMHIPNQEQSISVIKSIIPCIKSETFDRPGYYVLSIENTIPCICVLFILTLFATQILFFVGSISLYLFHTTSLSQTTHRLQRQFFYSMCFQIFIPFFVVVFPVVYVTLSIWYRYYNQAATNIAMLTLANHGILTTLTMLMVHTPYRLATFQFFNLNSVRIENSSQQIRKASTGII